MGQNCCAPGAEDAASNDISSGATPARPGMSNGQGMSKTPSPPSAPPPGAAAKAKAQPKAQPKAAPAPASSGGGTGGSGGLTFELALSDLDQAEELAYGTAFAGFGSGAETGSVPLDCAPLKEFLATNSCCTYDNIDDELLKVAINNEMKVSSFDFMMILRQHATTEVNVLNQFEGFSNGGDTMSSEDCRTALLLFKEDMGAQTGALDEARWNLVFDKVMISAEPTVSREAFRDYAFKVARIGNLAHFAKL